MMNMCTIQAGHKAYQVIRDEGLKKERIKCLLGAAGGPKWLILYGLDRAIYTDFLHKRKTPILMIGASIAAWRFAALSQADGLHALEIFKNRYAAQQYSPKPDRDEISAETAAIAEAFLPAGKLSEILSHPTQRLCIITARSKGLLQYESRYALMGGLAACALSNAVSRTLLQLYFDRFVFYDNRFFPSFVPWNDFSTEYIPIGIDNIKTALTASGSIPLIMKSVPLKHNGATSILRDGGLIDYQMDVPLSLGDDIALYPHYAEGIIPGWFDKNLPFRKPVHSMENVCIVSPSKEAVESLPYKKIPDRQDFYTFAGKDSQRMLFWEKAAAVSMQIAQEFMELVDSGKIKDRIVPFRKNT